MLGKQVKKQMMNRSFHAEDKKDRFITDHLFTYLIKHIEESNDSYGTARQVAAMYIFPFRTNTGIKIGSLREPGIPWYYDKEDGEKEYSTDSFRILAEEVLQEEQVKKIRQIFTAQKYLSEFTETVVIDNLITRMRKETDYTEMWWKCAFDLYQLWRENAFVINTAKATENIDNNCFLFLDDYCDYSLKERLLQFGVFKDVLNDIAKRLFWDKITDPKEQHRAINILKELGIPHSFSIKTEGYWTGVSMKQEGKINKYILQFASDIGQSVLFPVIPDNIDYQKCDLCHELFMNHIYTESKNDSIYASVRSAFESVVMIEEDIYPKGIPVKNIEGGFVPLSWHLFYSNNDFNDNDISTEENDVFTEHSGIIAHGEFEKLHIDVSEYDRDFIERYKKIHELETAYSTYDKYGVDESDAVGFYQWLWDYSHNGPLSNNILSFFSEEKRRKYVVSEKYNSFILSVLEDVEEPEYESYYCFNMLIGVDDAFSKANVLNKINRFFEGITVNISGRYERIDVGSYVKDILQDAEASFSIRSQIQDDAIWDSVYITSGENDQYSNTYVLGKPLGKSAARSIFLWPSEYTEKYSWVLSSFIRDEYNINIKNTRTDWKDSYVSLAQRIHNFVSETMDVIPIDSLPFHTVNMDDIANFGEEKRLWKKLHAQQEKFLNGTLEGDFTQPGKPYLNARYRGRCQLCGGKTITGEMNSRFYTYRMAKESQNSLANLPSNLFCVCPSCWGELEAGSYMGKDMSEIIIKARKYAEYLNKIIVDEDFEDDFPSLISELQEEEALSEEEKKDLVGFNKPMICRVIVHGQKRCMAFSWEHFMRIAFILSEFESNEQFRNQE